MRRSAEKQEVDFENETQNEPNPKKRRSDNRIATLDNGTLLEALKFLNYCQLATNSLVSKKFRDLICIQRNSLALLSVRTISMAHDPNPAIHHSSMSINVFDEELSPEAYNKWVILNGYSKKNPLEGQIYEKISQIYVLEACADYKDSQVSWLEANATPMFLTRKEVNHENWPVFQHFVRLLTDPFIFIRSMELTHQTDILSLLTASIISQERSRLRCERLELNLRGIGILNLISWIKGHVLCKEFEVYDYSHSNHDAQLLDLFMTGANCTSEIIVKHYDLSNVLIDLVKKFMDIKTCDEFNMVQSMENNSAQGMVMEKFKREHAKFLVKEENENGIVTHTFKFLNNGIGKKMRLTITNSSRRVCPHFSLKIDNLTITTLDNDTMVEAFKHLNYSQLAQNSLVSKRFLNLIRTHRHTLARFYVHSMSMRINDNIPAVTLLFNKCLHHEAYHKWVIQNRYSKQVPLEDQMVEKQGEKNDRQVYVLEAVSEDPGYSDLLVFFTRAELNHENWPLFQHFVRLLTDPFIYVRTLEMIPQIDVSNLLLEAMNPYGNRTQCGQLTFSLDGSVQKFITWIKKYALCEKVHVNGLSDANYDEEFLHFIMTGADCASEIHFLDYTLSKCVVDLVQKFKDLKSSEECHIVESVWGNLSNESADVLKRNYSGCIVKEEKNQYSRRTEHVFEFVNIDVGKKLHLAIVSMPAIRRTLKVSLKVTNV